LEIHEQILPNALGNLSETLMNGKTVQDRVSAAHVLREIGREKEFELLGNVAKTSMDDTVRQAAYDASWQKVFAGRERWRGYNDSYSIPNVDDQIDFLVDVAQPGSRSRTLALETLASMSNPRAREYYKLLTLVDRPGAERDKTTRAFMIMKNLPDLAGKQMAWQEANKWAGSNNEIRIELALATLAQVPEMRSQAVDMLVAKGTPRVLTVLDAVARGKDPELAAKAEIGIERIKIEARISDFTERLNSTDVNERIAAITTWAGGWWSSPAGNTWSAGGATSALFRMSRKRRWAATRRPARRFWSAISAR
jgi:hypothetical protein